MATNQDGPGGHNIEFLQDLDTRLKCSICKLPLRNPHQTSCGHRFCESCIKNVIENGDQKCPEDGTVLTVEDIFPDRFCNREILDQHCYCRNKSLGCMWTGMFRAEKDHQKECLYVEQTCPNDGCELRLLRRDLEEHMAKDCKFKKIPCQYCGIRLSNELLNEHLETTCPNFPLDCPKMCGQKVLRCNMETHLLNDCPKAESSCPLFPDCNFQGSRSDLKKHMSEKQITHVTMLNGYIKTLDGQVKQLETSTTAITEMQSSVDEQLKNHHREIVKIHDDLEALRASHGESSSFRAAESSQANENMSRGASKPDEKPRDDAIYDQAEIDNIKRRLSKLEEQVASLMFRERHSVNRVQFGGGDDETVSDLERRIASLEHQNSLSDVQIADHDVKLNMLDSTSYEGTFIWKIEDFGRISNDAQTGRSLSIYSPQFYVGRYGYKVCARVYPNGDGMGKNTHLSLFFVLMRGNYDALLTWPFRQKVTFKLIDQNGDQHIVDSFRPDPNSSSFQRPRSNMNIASGCPLFVPKSALQRGGYIRDDTIFIKITVDTTGLNL
ncbi:TNF receptor-associated factor 3-like [Xenia sp. Carnegie-2017]|uniref:TNF receptor-associated factor 3-like n=1 Tax=Xenia sp. Carnegie-2017 TaxID=2897299 RepID=UPI001F04A471|nr:TNF receptor-associated factor 3-like [Xenia sp. Carnegie-2017]XP_046860119.1 TNF receptor-associated factor 3-like [Xenia sp. Carnegie-2017]